jgi:hypothetical protein
MAGYEAIRKFNSFFLQISAIQSTLYSTQEHSKHTGQKKGAFLAAAAAAYTLCLEPCQAWS